MLVHFRFANTGSGKRAATKFRQEIRAAGYYTSRQDGRIAVVADLPHEHTADAWALKAREIGADGFISYGIADQ